jgi:hypothetical protein
MDGESHTTFVGHGEQSHDGRLNDGFFGIGIVGIKTQRCTKWDMKLLFSLSDMFPCTLIIETVGII